MDGEIEAPSGADNQPIFSVTGQHVTEKRTRGDNGEEDLPSQWLDRTEPVEADLETMLTDGMESYVDRWTAISQWEELFHSPHHRGIVYKLILEDCQVCCHDLIDGRDDTVTRDAIKDIVKLFTHTLWKVFFSRDYRKRKKKHTKAEGALGEEAMQEERTRMRDLTTLAFDAFIEELEEHWEVQQSHYGFSTEEVFHTEVYLLWYIRFYLCLCERGFRPQNCRTTENDLVTFQNVYPALGMVPQNGPGSVSSYSQRKLIVAIETLWQNWNETPYSKDLFDYVYALFHRYSILMVSVFVGKTRMVLDMDGMFHERDQSCSPVPATGMGNLRNLGMEYIGAEEGSDIGGLEGDETVDPVRSVNENYVTMGLNRLCPIVQIVDVTRSFLFNGEDPEESHISEETWMTYMNGFLRYAQIIIVDNLTTRDYIRDDFRTHIYDFMLKPGEAVQFASKHIDDSFNPYNIINRTRTADVGRLEKLVMEKNPEYTLNLFGKRLTDEDTDESNESAFKDSRNSWVALQYACVANFFNSGRLYKGWGDFMLEGNGIDVAMFLYGHYGKREEPPVIALPRIFRVAASFLVYIPWTNKVVRSPGFIKSFEGGLVSGLLVAVLELRMRIDELLEDPTTQSKRALAKELTRFDLLCEAIRKDFFMVADEREEEMSEY